MNSADVRSMLEYVPYFRDKLFVIHIAASLLDAEELVDVLLDIKVLHEIGVKSVIVTEGDDCSAVFARTRVCEMRTAVVEYSLNEGEDACSRVIEIAGRNQIPVVSSGMDGVFDERSVFLSIRLNARKFIALVEDERIVGEGVEPIPAVHERDVKNVEGAEYFLEILNLAANVCRMGVQRVHILNGKRRGVLLDELFSEEGVGTMIHSDSYREIRPIREEDIPEVLSMVARSMMDSKLVDRSYEEFANNLSHYYVLTLDESIIGCIAVYPYPENNSAELGCLYIKRSFEGMGYGKSLCAFAQEKAKEMGAEFIFAVSQSAVYYFRDRLNYAQYPRESLPDSRRKALENSGRQSGVFGRML